MFPKDIENIYWLFAASAQSIATFFAFLLAGYTIVLNIMDNKEDRDGSLEEVHHQLKTNYHRQLTGLALLTAFAITISLTIVYVNGFDYNLLSAHRSC